VVYDEQRGPCSIKHVIKVAARWSELKNYVQQKFGSPAAQEYGDISKTLEELALYKFCIRKCLELLEKHQPKFASVLFAVS